MDPVIIVCGKWVQKNTYIFNADHRGCRVLELNEHTTFGELVQNIMEDYGLDEQSCKIQLSYMFSTKTLEKLAVDTPPVYICNCRQLRGFICLRKRDELRLCVEVTEKEATKVIQKDKSKEKMKQPLSHVSEEELTNGRSEEIRENEDMESNDGNNDNENADKEEEGDEFDSRFDIFDNPDGASSDDDNFSLIGKHKQEDEVLPPKKRVHNTAKKVSKETDPVRLDLSSLNIVVGQRYESKEELEKKLKLLSVRDRFDFEVPVSRVDTLIVKCWVNGCGWRVRASRTGQSPEFYIRQYDSEHTCSVTERSTRSRQATPEILGPLYKDLIGDTDPSVLPRHVGVAINKQFGIKMDYWKAYRTLRFAREIELGTLEKGYQDLPSYLHMIKSANRGTLTSLEIDECGRFKYLFIAYGASIRGFRFMRKVVIVDGTFLHGKYKGTLLIALAQDGNFQIFPLAFAVVDTENDDAWQWFFTQLKTAIPDDKGLAIISDRHKSIGKAIRTVFPLAARGICTYHLYKNILLRFRGGNFFRLVKKAANCYRIDEFETVFRDIEVLNPELHGYLQRAGIPMWARVHFPGDRYNLTTTNIAESMNKVLSKARCYPIVRILETITSMMTRWFNDRREDAMSLKTTLTRGVENLLQDRVICAKLATVQTIDAFHTQVIYGTSLHVVNLGSKRCTCRHFDIDKLPCLHAIAAAEHKGVSRISLCNPYYYSRYLLNAYAGSVMPIDSALSVPEDVAEQVCNPPIAKNQPGRPSKSRIKSCLEMASEKKRPRKLHACSVCNQVGHNAKTCKLK